MSEKMDAKWRSDEVQDALADEAFDAERAFIMDESFPKQLFATAAAVMVGGVSEQTSAQWLRRAAVAVQAARAELEKCNDDWNLRYQQWADKEERLYAEIKGLRSFKASVDEALNTGNGTYRP